MSQILIVGLVMGSIGAAIDTRNRVRGFVLMGLLGVIGLFIILMLRRQERRRGPERGRSCPNCKKWIRDTATVCEYCGHDLTPLVAAPQAPPPPPPGWTGRD
jgi:hypothetical protein